MLRTLSFLSRRCTPTVAATFFVAATLPLLTLVQLPCYWTASLSLRLRHWPTRSPLLLTALSNDSSRENSSHSAFARGGTTVRNEIRHIDVHLLPRPGGANNSEAPTGERKVTTGSDAEAGATRTGDADAVSHHVYPSNGSHQQPIVQGRSSTRPASAETFAATSAATSALTIAAVAAAAPTSASGRISVAPMAASAESYRTPASVSSSSKIAGDFANLADAAAAVAALKEPKNDDLRVEKTTSDLAPAAAVTMGTGMPITTADGVPTVYIGLGNPLGRIGNIMFQYASGLALALRYSRRAVLLYPKSATGLVDDMRRIFRLSPLPVLHGSPPPATIDLVESGWGLYDAARFDRASTFERSVYTYGYYQSWKYFATVADRVRREFALSADSERTADSYFRSVGLQLRSEGSLRDGESLPVRVGVHVRRGDMIPLPHLYTVAPAEYVFKAIAHYRNKYAAPRYNVSFVLATDDHAWVHEHVASRLQPDIVMRYVNLDVGGDMAVLSSCDHSIVTGGTFGWWSAWLAGGDVVYYRDFIRPTSGLYASYSADDYYPPEWIGMTG